MKALDNNENNVTITVNGTEVAVPNTTTIVSLGTTYGPYMDKDGNKFADHTPATDKVKSGDVYNAYSKATINHVTGDPVVVYGVDGTVVPGVKGTAAQIDGANPVTVENVKFDKSTEIVITDGFYSITLDGAAPSYKRAGTAPFTSNFSYAIVNDKIVDISDGYTMPEEDIVVTCGIVKLDAPTCAGLITEDNWYFYGDDVVDEDGDYYALYNTTATLVINTETIKRTTKPILAVTGNGTDLKSVNITSTLGNRASGDLSTDKVTFTTNETYNPGTIEIDLAVTKTQNAVTLTWGNS